MTKRKIMLARKSKNWEYSIFSIDRNHNVDLIYIFEIQDTIFFFRFCNKYSLSRDWFYSMNMLHTLVSFGGLFWFCLLRSWCKLLSLSLLFPSFFFLTAQRCSTGCFWYTFRFLVPLIEGNWKRFFCRNVCVCVLLHSFSSSPSFNHGCCWWLSSAVASSFYHCYQRCLYFYLYQEKKCCYCRPAISDIIICFAC